MQENLFVVAKKKINACAVQFTKLLPLTRDRSGNRTATTVARELCSLNTDISSQDMIKSHS